ncbi:MAG: DUF2335 domain-containing protein [Desulfobacterales bacterium]|nr:DUF2335 domain-containing protein [Desulfobacterales bacterium]
MPPPELLGGYEDVLPGAAERIMVMAEGESAHQKEMERFAIELKSRENKRGQYLAMATVVVAFSAATTCAYFGAETAAAIIGGATLVGLVTVFVTGRSGGHNDNSKKTP